ncbi:MAG: redoxin domain-containing protein [Phycisphaerales bacterium]|nr:MAG: redoxin domain-containing protein [Phycisphaerales bacterium]
MILILAWCGLPGIAMASARTESLVPAGEPAPELTLATLEGPSVRIADHRGRPVVLLFGELYNTNSVEAASDISTVLHGPPMSELNVSTFLIITQDAPAAQLAAEAADKGITLPILHDPQRHSFAAYHVIVLPSLVVIDPTGLVTLSCPGYPLDFQDLVTDALFFAAGQLTEEQFSRRRAAATLAEGPEGPGRARWLSALGEQLATRGSAEMALSKFQEALEIDPDCIPAHIGLGTLMLNSRNLPRSEEHFRYALGLEPGSVDAALGLVQIEALRGGAELESAHQRLLDLLRRRPDDPRVRYLAGFVAERMGDTDAALGYYRRASELLLYGRELRWETK